MVEDTPEPVAVDREAAGGSRARDAEGRNDGGRGGPPACARGPAPCHGLVRGHDLRGQSVGRVPHTASIPGILESGFRTYVPYYRPLLRRPLLPTYVEYARFADDLVILVDAHPRHAWLLDAVNKRLREELALLHVEVNDEKSRLVDLAKGAVFGFLGFTFRRLRSRRGIWWPQRTPQLKKRTALLRQRKAAFRHLQSQPVSRVIDAINPVLWGWVQYFAHGNASRCFSYVRNWVEQAVRRHLMRARNRPGLGWMRWSRRWLYDALGLYADYRIRYPRAPATALPTR